MWRESYCGLCDDCQLGNPEFLKVVSLLQEYLDRFRANWWVHCFPGEEGFSFPELRRGLEWFLTHTECPGCKGGRGLDLCPIRSCAISRGVEHCSHCPDLEPCELFAPLMEQFPEVKINLRRRQLKLKARQFHQQLGGTRKEV
jgi:hypothetical protein|uniref:DUF3795 domain-containing protein n=1 Tax=Desulfobacca acetoxidans TaxID=60893 RepID=A0A7C5AKG6_9BACT